jgi:hypothetical protein
VAHGAPRHVTLPRCKWSTTPCHPVGSNPLPVMPMSGQLRGAALLSCTVAPRPHVLQVMMMSPLCTSCRPMMALASGVLETCVHALHTREPSCISRSARPFFIYMRHTAHWGSWDARQHRDPPWPGGIAWSHRTCSSTGARLNRWMRSAAIGHVTASEFTSARRRGPEPHDTWQRRSPPWQGGEVQSYRAHV